MLGIALILAIGRTYIRIVQKRSISVDDGFFLLAVATLIGGTTTCYIHIPYLYPYRYIQQNDNQSTPASPQLIRFLLRKFRVGFATDTLLSTTLVAVKFSFLFFFRGLLRRVRGLMIWWWCVFGLMVPILIYFICAPFIVCPHFNTDVFGE